MNLIKTKLDGLVVLKPTVFKDNRGYFMESYNQKNLVGIKTILKHRTMTAE